MKVLLFGPEGVGKTSLVKSLKGEAFNREEPSTKAVVINSPIKTRKNASYDHKTTPSDRTCADLNARGIKDRPAEHKSEQSLEPRIVVNGMLPFCLMQMFLKCVASWELVNKSI